MDWTKKAKELIEIMKKIRFKIHHHMKIVGNLQGYCSRRIIQHRIVFQVIEEPNIHEGIEYEGYKDYPYVDSL